MRRQFSLFPILQQANTGKNNKVDNMFTEQEY